MSLLEGFTQAISVKILGFSDLAGTMSKSISELDKFEKKSKSLMKMGTVMTGVGVGMLGMGTMAALSTNATTKALGELSSVGVKDMTAMERAAASFSNRFAGTTKADFISAAYDIKSGISSLSDEAVGQFTRIAALTAKATKASVADMTSLFATGYGIYKEFYSGMTDFEFGEMFSGGIASAVQAFKTTGPEMAAAISNLSVGDFGVSSPGRAAFHPGHAAGHHVGLGSWHQI